MIVVIRGIIVIPNIVSGRDKGCGNLAIHVVLKGLTGALALSFIMIIMSYRILQVVMAIFALLALGAASPARAQQERIPSIDLSAGAKGEVQAESFTAGRPVFNYSNTYLNDILELQYQTTLLEKMIVRQGSISRLENAYINVGIPFEQPLPPKGICEQIPANVPCYSAYPDLYPEILPEVEEAGIPADMGMAEPVTVNIEPPKPSKLESGYKWAEIMCRGGDCSAVVSNGTSRRTVREGDDLNDNIVVTSITSKGVTVSRDGLKEVLQSALAPSRGGLASPKYAHTAINKASSQFSGNLEERASQLENALGNDGSNGAVAPLDDAPDDVPVPKNDTAISDPGPPLGPTGLY